MLKNLSVFAVSALIFAGIPLAWSTEYLILLFVSNITPSFLLSALYILPPIVLVRLVFRRAVLVELQEKDFSPAKAAAIFLGVLALVVILAVISQFTFPLVLETL